MCIFSDAVQAVGGRKREGKNKRTVFIHSRWKGRYKVFGRFCFKRFGVRDFVVVIVVVDVIDVDASVIVVVAAAIHVAIVVMLLFP